MTFHSILFNPDTIRRETPEQPAFFPDLNLDQVIEVVVEGRQEYDLKPFFYTPLHQVDSINYRHEVMRDMENEALMSCIKAFAEKMIVVRRYLGFVEKLEANYHKKGWFLEAVLVYGDAVTSLAHELAQLDLRSRGFQSCRDYLTDYVHSDAFTTLLADAQKMKSSLSHVRYSVIVEYRRFKVRGYEGEAEYTPDVEKTFAKFKKGAVRITPPNSMREPG